MAIEHTFKLIIRGDVVLKKTYMRPVLKILKYIILVFSLIEAYFIIDAIVKKDFINLIFVSFLILFILFIAIFAYYSEYKGKIQLDYNSITFFYHVFSKHKGLRGLNWKTGLEIKFDYVETFKITKIPGIILVSRDSVEYYIKQKDGRDFTFFLFHFGKQEKEIREYLIDSLKDKSNL